MQVVNQGRTSLTLQKVAALTHSAIEPAAVSVEKLC